MLRLGRKYDIVYLENEALQRLRHDYPTTLNEWDSLHEDTKPQIDPASDVHEIISIAHEFALNTILPAAYVRYLETWTIVASFIRKMLCFLIVSSSRRLYWMILVYPLKRANIA
jgi:chorismate mutase